MKVQKNILTATILILSFMLSLDLAAQDQDGPLRIMGAVSGVSFRKKRYNRRI